MRRSFALSIAASSLAIGQCSADTVALTSPGSDPSQSTANERSGFVSLSRLSSLLVFPPVNNAANPQVATIIVNTMKATATLDRTVRLVAFSPHLPGVQRGLDVDSSITIADVQPPFSIPIRAKKLSDLLGTDGYVLSNVISETVDQSQRTVEVKVSLQAFANRSQDALATVTVSGGAIASSPDEDLAAIEERACQSAGRKAFYAFYPQRMPQSTDKKQKRR